MADLAEYRQAGDAGMPLAAVIACILAVRLFGLQIDDHASLLLPKDRKVPPASAAGTRDAGGNIRKRPHSTRRAGRSHRARDHAGSARNSRAPRSLSAAYPAATGRGKWRRAALAACSDETDPVVET